ncbi:hypothetical protein VTI74DRAFT_2366 [Chaetomium olivicolor]
MPSAGPSRPSSSWPRSTTSPTGLDWIKHFDFYTAPRTKGKKRLLILDGHESYHSTEFELYCQDNNIITLYIPPHSSYKL